MQSQPPIDPERAGQEGPPPTVLDWFKSLLRFDPIPIPEREPEPESGTAMGLAPEPMAPEGATEAGSWLPALSDLRPDQLRLPAGLFLALVAQFELARRLGSVPLNVGLYVAGALLVAWAILAGDVSIPTPYPVDPKPISLTLRPRPLYAGLAFGLLTFLTAGGNQFRTITILAWILSMVLVLIGLWEGELEPREWLARARLWLRKPSLDVRLSGWGWVLLGALVLIAVFRFADLARIPYEMWSDQAEKLLDVHDVLNGDHKIFFPRNSGREAIEFYWAVLFGKVFGTGLSFLTLKMVTAVAGFLAMPFLYLFGREIGGRRVGLLAMLMAGFAFWPNITSRAGLRMPLNELFVAPALYFLFRGLRRGTRNDFLWSGLAVGLGLQGYSGARVLPLAVLVAVLLYLIYERAGSRRMRVLVAFSGLVLVSIIGFLPLFRALIDMPDQVLYRTLTRIGTVEQPYPGPPVLVFLQNTWDILKMFSWDNGQIWIETVPHRPALDWVTGAFFHLGIVAAAIGAWRRRRWDLLFLVVSIPIFLLPSSLALAFPNENPAPNRVTGAIVPVFTLAALALDAVYVWARRVLDRRWRVSIVLVGGLLIIAASVNYRLVFDTYAEQERTSAWNNTEAGAVMQGFDQSVGDFENVYFVVYPYWMDSRLAAINAGAPIRDYSVWPQDLESQALDPSRYHLFLIKPEDVGSISLLEELHPRGTLTLHSSQIPGRDFYMFLVPPEIQASPADPAPVIP